ncbi:hypothetical protein ACWEQN_31480 [Streptomyces sp. NPDC004129]
MKAGDYVTAVPVSEKFRELHPTVTGRLDIVSFEFMGDTIFTHHVVVNLKDGTEVHVDVEEGSLRAASPGRHPQTVL